MLDYVNDIIDNKIKDKKEAEKEYLDKLNYDRELLCSLKNRDREYERWFDMYNDLKKFVLGKFKTKKDILLAEDEKLAIAQGGMSESELESDKEQKGQGLKIMTQKQMIARLSILLAQLKAGNNSQK